MTHATSIHHEIVASFPVYACVCGSLFDYATEADAHVYRCRHCGESKYLLPDPAGYYCDAYDVQGRPFLCVCDAAYVAHGEQPEPWRKVLIDRRLALLGPHANPDHDADECGCENHAPWCPYNPHATEVTPFPLPDVDGGRDESATAAVPSKP